MDDFSVEPDDATMKNVCEIFGCKNIIKDKACFQNHINLIWVIENWLLNFHK